jgi:hypothetical protein
MAIGSLAISLKLPFWLIFFLLLAFIVIELSQEIRKIVIEEIDV